MKRELPLSKDSNTTLFFSKTVLSCDFNHYSDSLWCMYRLNFPIWNWKQLTDQSKRFKAASESQDINVIMRKAELENVIWVYHYSRFYSNYLLLYNYFKLGDLKQQQSFILLMSLQRGQCGQLASASRGISWGGWPGLEDQLYIWLIHMIDSLVLSND